MGVFSDAGLMFQSDTANATVDRRGVSYCLMVSIVHMLTPVQSIYRFFCFSKNFLAQLHRSEGVGMSTYRHSETLLVSKK